MMRRISLVFLPSYRKSISAIVLISGEGYRYFNTLPFKGMQLMENSSVLLKILLNSIYCMAFLRQDLLYSSSNSLAAGSGESLITGYTAGATECSFAR